MRKHRILNITVFFLVLFLFRFSCSDEEKDPIKLLVTCNAPFTGNFIYNSADPVGFGGPTGDNKYIISGSLYYYSIIFDDLDSIDVDASITRVSGDTTSYSLKIRIYNDEVKVKETSVDSSDETTDSLNLPYTYDETITST